MSLAILIAQTTIIFIFASDSRRGSKICFIFICFETVISVSSREWVSDSLLHNASTTRKIRRPDKHLKIWESSVRENKMSRILRGTSLLSRQSIQARYASNWHQVLGVRKTASMKGWLCNFWVIFFRFFLTFLTKKIIIENQISFRYNYTVLCRNKTPFWLKNHWILVIFWNFAGLFWNRCLFYNSKTICWKRLDRIKPRFDSKIPKLGSFSHFLLDKSLSQNVFSWKKCWKFRNYHLVLRTRSAASPWPWWGSG